MPTEADLLLLITAGLGGLAVVFLLLYFAFKIGAKYAYARKKAYYRNVFYSLFGGKYDPDKKPLRRLRSRLVLSLLGELTGTTHLPAEMMHHLKEKYARPRIRRKIVRQLGAVGAYRRFRAVQLAPVILDQDTVERTLIGLLSREAKWYIKLAAVNSLVDTGSRQAIDAILRTIPGSPEWYRSKIPSLLEGYGETFYNYFSTVFMSRIRSSAEEEPGLTEIFYSLAGAFPSKEVIDFLIEQVLRGDRRDAGRASEILLALRSKRIMDRAFFEHPVQEVRMNAVKTLQFYPNEVNIERTLFFCSWEGLYESALTALNGMISRKPELKEYLEAALTEDRDPVQRKLLITVLESRLEYYLMNIGTDKRETAMLLLEESLLQHRFAALIGFLNRNTRLDIENEILHVVGAVIETDPRVQEEFARYCGERILFKLGLSRIADTSDRKKIPLKKRDRRILAYVLAGIIGLPPLLYILASRETLAGSSLGAHCMRYLFDYTYFFAYYSLALNSSYILLLFSSFTNLFRQKALWKSRSVGYLFKRDVLPSVSILSPAFNEEKSVVENVRSLLNLQYPRFEVIVINDGSSDRTLDVLIENFGLRRQDEVFQTLLATQPVRGVYKNPAVPNLTIIDKMNGGKADSLNAGINWSSFEYICTIDADSLLEPESLTDIMYQTVTHDRETVAVGGNILPVNGCEVKSGNIRRVGLGRKPLVRFQTIEYFRAYLAGRLGWARTNGMLIISGAFGVFNRKRVLEIGGYLTGRGRYKKDTVGEDMELVVRLHKHMRKLKQPYHVGYAYNANCWTEIPESMRILYRQRDRWHRGLLEILLFHKTMIANPRFGPVGSLSIPYFIIFEIIGPFFELLGLIIFAVTAALGLLNLPLVLLLLVSVILLGIIISLASLVISENGIVYFSAGETLILLLFAVIENFGFRQIMSSIRVFSYVSFLFKEKGWGTMVRTGFSLDRGTGSG